MHALPPGDDGRPTYTEIWHYPSLETAVVVEYVDSPEMRSFDPDPSVEKREFSGWL